MFAGLFTFRERKGGGGTVLYLRTPNLMQTSFPVTRNFLCTSFYYSNQILLSEVLVTDPKKNNCTRFLKASMIWKKN